MTTSLHLSFHTDNVKTQKSASFTHVKMSKFADQVAFFAADRLNKKWEMVDCLFDDKS